MRLDQRIPVEKTRVFPLENLGTEEAANLVIQRIAQQGRGSDDADQGENIHTAFAKRRQRTRHEKQ